MQGLHIPVSQECDWNVGYAYPLAHISQECGGSEAWYYPVVQKTRMSRAALSMLEGRVQTPGLQSYIRSWCFLICFQAFGRPAQQDVGNPEEGLANEKPAD